MSLATLETAITAELCGVVKKRVRKKDVMEWRTTPISRTEIQPNETLVYLPSLKIWCAVLTAALPKGWKA